MGYSAGATLIYGFAIGGENGPEELYDDQNISDIIDDLEDVYAQKMGISKPHIADWNCLTPEEEELYNKYLTDSRSLRDNCKGVIEHDGNMMSGYTTDFISLVEATRSFYAWGPKEISPEEVEIKDHWRQDLMDFCELMGIPWQEPKRLIICHIG